MGRCKRQMASWLLGPVIGPIGTPAATPSAPPPVTPSSPPVATLTVPPAAAPSAPPAATPPAVGTEESPPQPPDRAPPPPTPEATRVKGSARGPPTSAHTPPPHAGQPPPLAPSTGAPRDRNPHGRRPSPRPHPRPEWPGPFWVAFRHPTPPPSLKRSGPPPPRSRWGPRRFLAGRRAWGNPAYVAKGVARPAQAPLQSLPRLARHVRNDGHWKNRLPGRRQDLHGSPVVRTTPSRPATGSAPATP